MATIVNPSDISLQATPVRLVSIALANNLLFSGNVTGTVNNVSASTITNSITNFNSSNDQNSSSIAAPVATTISGSDVSTNKDGSVNITLRWTWTGTETDIDGFILVSIGRTDGNSYTIGTDTAGEVGYVLPGSKRTQVLYGVAADRWYTFGVRAYRRVSNNITTNGSGIISSNISSAGPYRPSSSISISVDTLNTAPITSYQNSNIVLNADATNGNISLSGGGTSGSLTGVINTNRPINSSSYINNGVITNDHINVAGINANKITAGEISASLVTANTLQGKTINGGTLTAGAYTSTYAWPATGTGAHLSSAGLLIGNYNGNQGFFEFNASAGTLAIGKNGATKLALSSGGDLQLTGKLTTVNGVQIGDNVVQSGHYGLSLNSNDYTSVFMKRSDGVIFFRINTRYDGAQRDDGQHGIDFNTQSGTLSVYGDIVNTGNIKQNNVSVFYENSSSAAASDLSWYIGPMPYNITGILIDYNLGPETFTSGGKGSGGSIGGPLLTALKWNGVSANTGFIPGSSAPGGSYRTLYIARAYYDSAYPIKVSITFLLR